MNLGPRVNSPYRDHGACISADGLELYFGSFRPGGYGESDLWVATRATTNDEWAEPVNLGPQINLSEGDFTAHLSADGLSLYFGSGPRGRTNGGDLWVSTRPSSSEPWGEPVNLGAAVNSPSNENSPSISSDGLALFFASWRVDVPGSLDMYVSTRATTEDGWGPAVNLGVPINTTTEDATPSISFDGLTLYFASLRDGGPGNGDIWQVPIIRIVDFNGDGIVDTQDLLRMIGSWGKDDPSADIGPGPWGDHKVDAKDLDVLMSYWGQNVYDPTLIAHWSLDEAEGNVAADSVGSQNAKLVGGPLWQPAGGRKAGALLLDGVNDCIESPVILVPSAGPFSVFAWVKGGAPGQVLLSQKGSANWLMADSTDGALRTELKTPARTGRAPVPAGPPLVGWGTITDGDWHRVGLVRDGTERTLYVDDIEVARDIAETLEPAYGGLYIGAGSTLVSGTFWSGLIDDIRIYNRAVKP